MNPKSTDCEADALTTTPPRRLCFLWKVFPKIHFLKYTAPVKFSMKSNRRGGVVVRASASQSVDLGFISLVESYHKTLKNGIHSFPAWRSAHKG